MELQNLKPVIIDDEPNSRKTLGSMLERYCGISAVGEADGVSSGVKLIEKENPNLVFLDIKMNDGTGFDLLKKCKQREFFVIFTTAYDQFAIKAIKFSALDYLMKPIDPDELKTAVDKALTLINKADAEQKQKYKTLLQNTFDATKLQKIVFSTAEGMHVIEISNIIRCEADDYYTKVYISGRKFIMVSKTLKEVEKMLAGNTFVRNHKSHLVNVDFVKTYVKSDGGYLIMKTGEKVPVSRRKKETMLKVLQQL